MKQFKRGYWLLIAFAFFLLAVLNMYIVDLTQHAALFNLIASFFFFALFFVTKQRKCEDENDPKLEDENHKELNKK